MLNLAYLSIHGKELPMTYTEAAKNLARHLNTLNLPPDKPLSISIRLAIATLNLTKMLVEGVSFQIFPTAHGGVTILIQTDPQHLTILDPSKD